LTYLNNVPKLPFLSWLSQPVISNKSLFFLGGAEQSKNEPKQMIVLEWQFLTIAPCDAAEPWQLGSQDAATPMMQGIIDLHHDIFFFLILILVFVLLGLLLIFFFFSFFIFFMKGQNHNRKLIGRDGCSTSREPGLAQSGSPEDDDDPAERVRLQKKIRRRMKGLMVQFCSRYCKRMGFCGKYCSRGRENFNFLGAADEIARDEFFYKNSSATVRVLRKLLNFIKGYKKNDAWRNDDMNAHWLYDVMRRTPPSS
jgi:hypothetical protein